MPIGPSPKWSGTPGISVVDGELGLVEDFPRTYAGRIRKQDLRIMLSRSQPDVRKEATI
jgi:hypothetical protein